MLDRGLRRRSRPASSAPRERGARRARATRPSAATCATCRRSRSTRSPRRTSTTRSPPRRSTAGALRVWVHIADVSALRAARRAARPRGLPPRHERLRPRRGRADAARGAVQRRLLARARRATASRSRSSSSCDGARGRRRRLLPLADPLRRAPGLRPRRPDLRRRRAGAASRGPSRWRPRARPRRRSSRRAARRRRAGDRVGRAGVRASTTAAHVTGAAASVADRVAPADRAPDDRRQRGRSRGCCPSAASRRSTASTSAPSPRRSSGCSTSSPRSTSPTPPVPERDDALAGRRDRRAGARCSVDQHVRRTGHGRAGLTSLVLRALKQARYDPRNLGHAGPRARRTTATSPRRSAATRTSSATARCWPRSAAARTPPRAHGARGGRRAGRSARERDAMVIERDADDVARCFLLERELLERGWDEPFDGEVIGLIGAGAFVAFGEAGRRYEGLLPVRRLRGDWWELNEQGTILLQRRRRRRSASATRCASASSASRRRAGASTCASRRARRSAAPDARSRARRLASPADGRQAARPLASGDVATNRQARFRFELLDKLECGIVLLGTEVKSLREGRRSSRTPTRRSATASCGSTTCTSRPTGRPRARTTSPSARASCSPSAARSTA